MITLAGVLDCFMLFILLILPQMFSDETRKKLEYIIRGIVIEGQEDTCTAIRNLLCSSFSTSRTVKKNFEGQAIIKEKQVQFLKSFASENSLLLKDLPSESQFLTRGGEALVYLDADHRSVIKLNDAIYYATWLEFFNSIVIHNLLFPETAYIFLGFAEKNDSLLAVIKQPFIVSETIADLTAIKQLLGFNGFENTRRNDYYNKELGIILEDMHDENVIANRDTLFFIDTVFFTVIEDNL